MSARYRNNPDEIGEEYADVYLDDLPSPQNYNRQDPVDIQEEYADVNLTDLSSPTTNNTEAEYADVYDVFDDKKASSSDDGSSIHGVSNRGKNSSQTKTRNPKKSKANVNPKSTSNNHSRKIKPKPNVSDVNVSTRSPSNKPSRKVQPRQMVQSFYDEDHYALPDMGGDEPNVPSNEDINAPSPPAPTVTTSSSTQKLVVEEQIRPGFSNKQCCFFVFGVFILNAGAACAIYFLMFHNPIESGKNQGFTNNYSGKSNLVFIL